MIYREPPYKNLIQGLDLALDPHTQKICETYNQSSGASRSILYVLLIVSVVSLTAVFNSNPIYNWPNERIYTYKKDIIQQDSIIESRRRKISIYKYLSAKGFTNNPAVQPKLEQAKSVLLDSSSLYKELIAKNPDMRKVSFKDSIAKYDRLLKMDKLDSAELKNEVDAIIKSNVDNDSVKVAIIGIQIDLNDLASISGIAFIILLYLLRFTLMREKSNIKLAFNSITERYPNDANFEFFKKQVKDQETAIGSDEPIVEPILEAPWFEPKSFKAALKAPVVTRTIETWRWLIADINFTRRRSHYNFLSMNEIFNMPFLDTSDNRLQETKTGKVVNNYLFYFFFLIYSYILFNDFCSYDKGMHISNFHTFVIMALSISCYFIIYSLCDICANQKNTTGRLFSDFYYGQYLFNYQEDYSVKPSNWVIRFVFPILFLIGLDWLSIFFRAGSPFLLTVPFVKDIFKYIFHY